MPSAVCRSSKIKEVIKVGCKSLQKLHEKRTSWKMALSWKEMKTEYRDTACFCENVYLGFWEDR